MLELHVWGPGFGLPSIDPLCLSAIAYLNLVLDPSEWIVIPSSNPLLSPSRSLPALRDGHTWHTTLPSIIAFLTQRAPNRALDSALHPREAASATAFTALIQSRAQELIDISLYVSHANFSAQTRPLYSKLLPFPLRYYLPLTLRSAARERVQHLGFSGIDLLAPEPPKVLGETIGEQAAREAAEVKKVQIAPEAKAGIRLTAMADELLDALQERLGDGRFFFGDDAVTSLDCVAVGYLSLLLVPEMPFSFAGDAVRRHARLAAYLHELRPKLLGPMVETEAVLEGKAAGLPWGPVERGDVPWLTGVFLDGAKQALTPWRSQSDKKEKSDDGDPLMEERLKKVNRERRREWWKSVGFVTGSVAAMVGYVLWSGIVAIGGDSLNQEEEEVLEEQEVHENDDHGEEEVVEVDDDDDDDDELAEE